MPPVLHDVVPTLCQRLSERWGTRNPILLLDSTLPVEQITMCISVGVVEANDRSSSSVNDGLVLGGILGYLTLQAREAHPNPFQALIVELERVFLPWHVQLAELSGAVGCKRHNLPLRKAI